MRTARWLTVMVLLVGLLVTTQVASPSTPTLMNELPLGRCYARCDDLLFVNFQWCAQGCRCVFGGADCGG